MRGAAEEKGLKKDKGRGCCESTVQKQKVNFNKNPN